MFCRTLRLNAGLDKGELPADLEVVLLLVLELCGARWRGEFLLLPVLFARGFVIFSIYRVDQGCETELRIHHSIGPAFVPEGEKTIAQMSNSVCM